jgi:hypothetical protein
MANEPLLHNHKDLICRFTHAFAPYWRIKKSLRNGNF